MGLRKKKTIGWLIGLTFGMYVLHDATRFMGWAVSHGVLSLLFLVASLSALVFTWQIFKGANESATDMMALGSISEAEQKLKVADDSGYYLVIENKKEEYLVVT